MCNHIYHFFRFPFSFLFGLFIFRIGTCRPSGARVSATLPDAARRQEQAEFLPLTCDGTLFSPPTLSFQSVFLSCCCGEMRLTVALLLLNFGVGDGCAYQQASACADRWRCFRRGTYPPCAGGRRRAAAAAAAVPRRRRRQRASVQCWLAVAARPLRRVEPVQRAHSSNTIS